MLCRTTIITLWSHLKLSLLLWHYFTFNFENVSTIIMDLLSHFNYMLFLGERRCLGEHENYGSEDIYPPLTIVLHHKSPRLNHHYNPWKLDITISRSQPNFSLTLPPFSSTFPSSHPSSPGATIRTFAALRTIHSKSPHTLTPLPTSPDEPGQCDAAASCRSEPGVF